MTKCWLTYMALVVVLCISACSTANVGTVDVPDGSARNASFTAQVEEGIGSFSPVLEVEQAGALTAVKIYAERAVALEAAYLNLGYDSAVFSPDRVEFGDFLGEPGSVLTLALTNVSDVVPVGAVQIAGSGTPASGDGLLATVYFRRAVCYARTPGSVPNNAQNAVDDLKIIDQAAGSVTLAWTERNIGDYDNNGEVSISDLTPIAILYGQVVATAADPIWADLVDGDGNGEINSADITPIGLNFGNVLAATTSANDQPEARRSTLRLHK
jgi:hypothetical protein